MPGSKLVVNLPKRAPSRVETVRKVKCICGKQECLNIRARYHKLDSRMSGYFYLQAQKELPCDDEARAKNFWRNAILKRFNVDPSANRAGHLFVAYHHFHPCLLRKDRGGIINTTTIDVAMELGLGEDDQIRFGTNKGLWYPIPTLSWEMIRTEIDNGEKNAKNMTNVDAIKLCDNPFPRRSCICKKKGCWDFVSRWNALRSGKKEHLRGGYVKYQPLKANGSASLDTVNTGNKRKLRDLICAHFGVETVEEEFFVASHHFHPGMLKRCITGEIETVEYFPNNAVISAAGLSFENRIQNGEHKGHYFCVPTFVWDCMERDLSLAEEQDASSQEPKVITESNKQPLKHNIAPDLSTKRRFCICGRRDECWKTFRRWSSMRSEDSLLRAHYFRLPTFYSSEENTEKKIKNKWRHLMFEAMHVPQEDGIRFIAAFHFHKSMVTIDKGGYPCLKRSTGIKEGTRLGLTERYDTSKKMGLLSLPTMTWENIHNEVLLAENNFQKSWTVMQKEVEYGVEATDIRTEIARMMARMKAHPNQVAKELCNLRLELTLERTARKSLEIDLKVEMERRVALEERLRQFLQVADG